MARSSGRSIFSALAALATTLVLGAGAQGAAAATVEAREEPSTTATSLALIDFRAAAGEANQVTITASPVADGKVDVAIVDAGASVEAKTGCSGGGPPGAPVHCLVHAPKGPDYETCGRSCILPIAGTDWRVEVAADLGDEPNRLDAASLPQEESGAAIELTVTGGPARDEIATGPGADRIDPRAGTDVVKTGGGYDAILAAAGPDGDDLYDLGEPLGGEVDYSERTEPLVFEHGLGGGRGEKDQIPFGLIVGGSGDDTMVGGEGPDAFEGRGGDDTLVGNGQRDWLYGEGGDDRLYGGDGEDRLVGGPGDDIYEGGADSDALMETDETSSLGRRGKIFTPEQPGGTDVVKAGPGDDWMSLGAGADRVFGEEGDDRIVTGGGADEVDGGPGDDVLAGGADFDRIAGGAGEDTIFAGPQIPENGDLNFAPNDVTGVGPDRVDCGSGADEVAIDAGDRVHGCERVRLKGAVRTGKPIREKRHGTALLPVQIGSPGRVIVFGRGVARIVRNGRASPGGHPVALMPVRPRGLKLDSLRRHGRCAVRLTVRYIRRGGGAFTAKPRLTLILAR
jgi:Ca2+-binding RTX toxin-like protein